MVCPFAIAYSLRIVFYFLSVDYKCLSLRMTHPQLIVLRLLQTEVRASIHFNRGSSGTQGVLRSHLGVLCEIN